MRSVSRVRNRTATTSVGLTIGRVIRMKDCQAVAPSTLAASYTSAGMVCSPARVSSPMKGAVFQTSAITIAQNDAPESASQRIWVPRTRFITPASSKISFHIRADTMVGMAQGTRMPARTMPRPRKALAMIRAIATPRMVSRITQTMVMKVVFRNAFQNRSMVP